MKRALFNDNWLFSEGDSTSLDMLYQATTGAPEFKSGPVTLPHDAVIHTAREKRYAGACTGFYTPKNIFYTKKFSLDPADADKCIYLEFEGAFQYAFVFVNEMRVGRCMYGYGNYYLDITNYVCFDKPNAIKVVLRNGVDSSRWYSGGGLYRDVHILMGDRLHVACEGARVHTVSIDPDSALIEIATPVEYAGSGMRTMTVQTELLDADGNRVGRECSPVTFEAAGMHEAHQRINLPCPRLWDTETPNLYCCKTTLLEGERILDRAETRFGVRTLQLDAVHGLRLNGKTVKLKGGSLHHDNGVVGAATFYDSEARRVRKLKAAGYNALRSAPNPFSRAMLEACDEQGMLVYDELSDVWTVSKVAFDYAFTFEDSWERDLTNLVLRDYNHPSVVLYSIGNEIQELANANGKKWSRILAEKVRALDGTRFVTLCMNPVMCILEHMNEIMTQAAEMAAAAGIEMAPPAAADDRPLEINSTMDTLTDQMSILWKMPIVSSFTEESCANVDLVGLNYATDLYEPDHERFPNRVMFGSENYHKFLAKNWEIIERNPWVIGDFCWAAWDYLGEAGIGDIDHLDGPKGTYEFYGDWPWKTAYCGAFDLIGDPTPVSYWRELVWKNRTAPYISVRPPEFYGRNIRGTNWCWITDSISSWNWAGYEGRPIEVEVYTRAESVELFVNGRSVGRKAVGEGMQYVAVFETVYEPGEICARASDGGEFILHGAQDERHILAQVDDGGVNRAGRELSYVELSITDANGVLNPASCKRLHVEIEGDGVLQGFGSADPKSTENFFDRDVAAYHGRALAVVRHNPTRGPVKLTFSAEGCPDEVVEL